MLARKYDIIGIRELDVKGMMSDADHKLARFIADMSFFEFRRQLEYKTVVTGAKLVVADKWFPSSKTCNVCGAKTEITLSDRKWVCKCGSQHDRDINAALNLRNYALSHIEEMP
jgi:putative transposase